MPGLCLKTPSLSEYESEFFSDNTSVNPPSLLGQLNEGCHVEKLIPVYMPNGCFVK